jgi:hypothetical protein
METGRKTRIRLCGSRPQDGESVWATPVGSDLYRLENSPFFAYGVSWMDVVEALMSDLSNMLEFVQCVRKSGNRTVRIFFEGHRLNDEPAQQVLSKLRLLGCSYEGMQPRLVSVNVPPEVDLSSVTTFLSNQPGIQWEYADPTYEQVEKS